MKKKQKNSCFSKVLCTTFPSTCHLTLDLSVDLTGGHCRGSLMPLTKSISDICGPPQFLSRLFLCHHVWLVLFKVKEIRFGKDKYLACALNPSKYLEPWILVFLPKVILEHQTCREGVHGGLLLVKQTSRKEVCFITAFLFCWSNKMSLCLFFLIGSRHE